MTPHERPRGLQQKSKHIAPLVMQMRRRGLVRLLCLPRVKKYMDTGRLGHEWTILSGFKAELFFDFYPVCLDLTRFKYKPGVINKGATSTLLRAVK